MVKPRRSFPNVGIVLRELRAASGLTQEELGRRAGVSMTYVSLVETGKRNPTISAISALLTVLDTSWTEFGRRLDNSGS